MSANAVRFSPELEAPKPNEEAIQRGMIEQFEHIQTTTANDYGRAVRGVHAKSHGIVVGKLEVLDGLPAQLAQGAFATPGTHDVVLRFSTNPGDILDDSVSTPRGLAIKIFDVPGERLPGAEGATQDFVMADAPAFVAPDAAAFLKSLKMLAKTTDTPQVFKKALSALFRGLETVLESVGTKSGTLVALGGHPQHHILGETFYSQVPVRWGDYVAKVSVAPVSPKLVDLAGAKLNVNGKPNGLREAVENFFAQYEGVWELRAQLLTNLDSMPIEDASVPWPEDASPYVPVARITVPAQEAWSEASQKTVDEGYAFSPWHGLAAHQPLGSIMRARKTVYPRSAGFRGERNGCPMREPARPPEG